MNRSTASVMMIAMAMSGSAAASPYDPEPQKSGLSVALHEKKPIRLINDATGHVSLDGELEAVITNAGPSMIRLVPNNDVHGLVFTPENGGAPFVVVHDCQCGLEAAATKWPAYGVLQGKPRVIKFDTWGCSAGAFPPPPPGRYRVSFRTLVYTDPMPPSPTPAAGDIKQVISQCRSQLASAEYWQHALVSNELHITLAAPQRSH